MTDSNRQLFFDATGLLAVFDFFLNVFYCVFEFTNAFAEALHEIRNFTRAKKDQNKQTDQQDFVKPYAT